MTAVDETEVLKITATTQNAELSASLCNIMADVAQQFLIRVVGAGSVEKLVMQRSMIRRFLPMSPRIPQSDL